MNIFRKYTRKSLMKNRIRTLVTIIGIILSMSMFTAVTEGVYSGLRFLVNAEAANSGAYHLCFTNTDSKERAYVESLLGVKETAALDVIGYAGHNADTGMKPYLLIASAEGDIGRMAAVRLIDGRMPQSENEILLPEHYATRADVALKIGDKVTLSVGSRISGDGGTLSALDFFEDGESIAPGFDRTYTVVGICARLDYEIEPYGAAWFFCLTGGKDAEDDGRRAFLFTELRTPALYDFFVKKYAGKLHYFGHTELLRLSGVFGNGSIRMTVFGFAGILVFLIAFGSISLIYNSFSISVSERTKEFGILKSIGATRKQIASSVLYEALVLAGIAIPLGMIVGCVGIGITFFCLKDSFRTILGNYGNVDLVLVLNVPALLIAAAICLVTTLVSAIVPARRALRITAMDAIRQTKDVRITRRGVRVSPLVEKIFGFPGMMAAKNFKRSRKRYVSVILSLALSIILFISASSFTYYLKQTVNGVDSGRSRADIVYTVVNTDLPDVMILRDSLWKIDGVNRVVCSFVSYAELLGIDPSAIDSRCQLNGRDGPSTYLAFLDDESFSSYCKENGLDPAEFLDASSPKGVLYNRMIYYENTKRGTKRVNAPVLKESALPLTATISTLKNVDGYQLISYTPSNGFYRYYSEYADDFSAVMSGERVPADDDENLLLVKEDEAIVSASRNIAAAVDRTFYPMPAAYTLVVYPLSAADAVIGGYRAASGRTEPLEIDFGIEAPDHSAVYSKIETFLKDRGRDTSRLYDVAASNESSRRMITVINVFSYGFITLISLIAATNVFNTISTSVMLRRREFAVLKSIGLDGKGFIRMMNYECIIYGFRSLLWGLTVAFAFTFLIWITSGLSYETSFSMPWQSVVIAVGSVFVVVFLSMFYAAGKIRKDNPIDALKNETL